MQLPEHLTFSPFIQPVHKVGLEMQGFALLERVLCWCSQESLNKCLLLLSFGGINFVVKVLFE